MKKLIGMTDYVLEQFKKWENDNNPDCQSSARYILGTHIYANFLKQPLTLGMFIPCYLRDGAWIPYTKDTLLNTMELFNEWEQAKSKVIFECKPCVFSEEHIRFDFDNEISLHWYKGSFDSYKGKELKTIEHLTDYNLTLTDNVKI